MQGSGRLYICFVTVSGVMMRLSQIVVLILQTILLSGIFSQEQLTVEAVEYGRSGDLALHFDAMVPAGRGPFPAAILVHGGGWSRGTRKEFKAYLFEPLLEAGVAAFAIDYRLAPAHPYPAAIEDIEAAIRFLRENGSRFRVDPARIALAGASAGGHLVSLIGARNRPEARVSAIVSFYGRVDLERGAATPGAARDAIQRFLNIGSFDAPAMTLLREASPIHWVRAGLPPFLAIHGTGDTVVPHTESVRMCEKIKDAGGECSLVLLEGAGHGMRGWRLEAEERVYREFVPKWLKERM